MTHLLKRPLRRRLAEQARIVGTMVQIDSCEIVEIAGHAGYDFVMLDAEHGALDSAALTRLIRAAEAVGIEAMVRVQDHGAPFIQRVMDAGAAGVMVPRVRSRSQADAAVRATRFAPDGERGACATSRAAAHWTQDWPAFAHESNANALVWALIEDPEGVRDIAEIAGVPGLDGLMFGAFDLAQTLGHDGDVRHPDVRAHFDRVHAAARTAGMELLAITASEPDGVQGALRRNARIVLDGFDAQIISEAYRSRCAGLVHALRDSPSASDRSHPL